MTYLKEDPFGFQPDPNGIGPQNHVELANLLLELNSKKEDKDKMKPEVEEQWRMLSAGKIKVEEFVVEDSSGRTVHLTTEE